MKSAEYLKTKYKDDQIVNIVKIMTNQTTKSNSYEFNKSKCSKV